MSFLLKITAVEIYTHNFVCVYVLGGGDPW